MFGPSSVIVRCADKDELAAVLEALEGQLTATLHIEESDIPLAKKLLPILERRAGRILANGWPTGVEVTHAMVHGGPFPATSDGRSTSVGTLGDRPLPAAGLLSGSPRGPAAVGAAGQIEPRKRPIWAARRSCR